MAKTIIKNAIKALPIAGLLFCVGIGYTHGVNTLAKELSLALLAAAVAFFSFWLWKEALPLFEAGVLANAKSFAAPIVALIFSGSLFLLASVLMTRAWLSAATAVAAGLLPFLLAPPPPHILIIIPVCVVLSLFAGRRMRREYDLSLGFSTAKIAKAGLPVFFTVASIIAAWFYFQAMQDQQRAAAALVPRPITDLVVRILAEPLKEATGLAAIDPDMTIDELLAAGLRKELGKNGVVLSRAGEQGITELLAHQRDAFARQYGITLAGNERVGDVMHRAIIERLETILGPFVRYLPLISALAFFFAFKAFTFPLYFISVALGALLIRLLRLATMVRSESREITVERLTL